MQMIETTRMMVLGLATLLAGASLAAAQAPEKKSSGRFVLEWRRDPDSRPHYYRSTASFEYATRLDHEITYNDWDLALRGSGTERRPYVLGVNTVTDDRSRIWNIGRVALKSVSKESVRARGVIEAKPDRRGQVRGLAPLIGHTYVVHTKDGNSDFWSAFKVIEIIPKSSVTIEWRLLTTPQRTAERLRKERESPRRRRRRGGSRES